MKLSKKTILFLSFVINFSNAYAVSFDCNKATTTLEKSICSSGQLSKLDDELNVAYKNAVIKNPDIKTSQREWIQKSRQCEKELVDLDECIKTSYQERITILKNENSAQQAQQAQQIQQGSYSQKDIDTQPTTTPEKNQYLIDEGRVLSRSLSEAVIMKLDMLQKGGNSVYIALTNGMGGVPISTYSDGLRQTEKKDIVIVVDVVDEKVNISVGEKMRAIISNQQFKKIIDVDLVPQLKIKDYGNALVLSLSQLQTYIKEYEINKIDKDIRAAKLAKEAESTLLAENQSERNSIPVISEVKKSSVSKQENNNSGDNNSKFFQNTITNIFAAILLAATIFAVISVPIALILRFKGGVIIIENLTDAAFTVGSLVVGFIFVISIAAMFSYEFKNTVSLILGAICFGAHVRWMYKVAKRSNISTAHIWIVTFSRILISCLPFVHMMFDQKIIQGKSSNESDAEYLVRYNEEVERNKQRKKDQRFVAILLAAITTLSIDKFSFEGFSSYFSRKTAFISDDDKVFVRA